MRDLESIVVLYLLAFKFIPQRSHYSQTLPRDSATVTLVTGGGTTNNKSEVIGIIDQLILQNGKKLRGVQEVQ